MKLNRFQAAFIKLDCKWMCNSMTAEHVLPDVRVYVLNYLFLVHSLYFHNCIEPIKMGIWASHALKYRVQAEAPVV